jgi:DnaJ-class molecular chaperone
MNYQTSNTTVQFLAKPNVMPCQSCINFYDILKIQKDALDNDIKKAYKRQILKYNPRCQTSDEEQDMFRRIIIAYYILSNHEYRKIYDVSGYDGLIQNGVYVLDLDYKKIYDDMFQNSLFTVDTSHIEKIEQTNIITVINEIPLKIIYSGKYEKVNIMRKSLCSKCSGTGSDDGVLRVCRKCQGRRVLVTIIDGKHEIRKCEYCNGFGINNKIHVCKSCNGERTELEQYCVEYMIPVGVSDDEIISVSDCGNINIGNNTRDIVNIHIKYVPDKTYLTKKTFNDCQNLITCDMIDLQNMTNNDIFTILPINLIDALCKRKISITMPDNNVVDYIPNNIIKPNDIHIIDNAGLPTRNNKNIRGKLYIIFQIVYPTKIVDDKIELFATTFAQCFN